MNVQLQRKPTEGEEDEIQQRNRIIRNQFKDRDNCIVLQVDTYLNEEKGISPFGFHFDLDKKKYEERKKQIKREKITRWLAWIAYYHHKFGIRHLLLVLLLTAWVFIGGVMFERLESPNEIEDLKQTLILMQGIIKEMSTEAINLTIVEAVEKHNMTVAHDKMGKLIKRYYKTMLEAEGRFHGSVWHKAENLELHLMWYFSSATFYAMTLFTTIGYGTIACQTFWGRFLSIVYASIGIPIMLVVLGDIGVWFQKILTKAYVFVLQKYRRLRKKAPIRLDEEVFLPIHLALLIVTVYVLLCTLIIKFFDHQEGNKPGIDFGSALYFVFISFTTIGLGDVMPYNIQYSPFLAAAFLLGLALVSIVNTSIYAVLYDIFFNEMQRMELGLERIHRQHHKPSGWRVFKDMEPAFHLLVMSFPHLERQRRQRVMSSIAGSFSIYHNDTRRNTSTSEVSTVESVQPKKKKKTVGFGGHLVRTRTESDLAVHDKEHDHDHVVHPMARPRPRAPTLGAFGGMELSRFRKQRKNTSDSKY